MLVKGRRAALALLALFAMGVPAAAADGAPAAAATGPQRIVSIGGDATEILYALGLGDKIVAVDSTSLYPSAALKEKVNVGYMRQLTTEGVLSTGATLILASAQAGPPDVVRALKGSSIRYETLPGNEGPDQVAEKIRFTGRIFGVSEKADALAGQVTQRFAAIAEKRKKIGKPLKAMFILGINNGRAMVGGKGSTADVVLGLAGAENAAASISGYKPITDEAMLGMAPDVVVTINRGDQSDAKSTVAALAGFKETPAGKAGRIIELDGNYLLGFGPRTPQAVEELMTVLYPTLQ